MKNRDRASMEMGSQDLSVDHMERFRNMVVPKGSKGKDFQELIMFSANAKPYQYMSLEAFREDLGIIPEDASYFYYTITYPTGDRCAIYLDPDRPARVVVEGEEGFVTRMKSSFKTSFPRGGSRYVLHGGVGHMVIWAAVVMIAGAVILTYSLLSEANPYLIAWVIFVSSLLGIYMSVAKAKEINPANTMALGRKRRKPMVDMLLHFITITLGIISVVLIILFFELNL